MSIATRTSKATLIAQVEALEACVWELEQKALPANDGSVTAQPDVVRELRELFEYAVLRPVDLVRLDGHPYFCYTRDLIYTLFAEHNPQNFIRNYTLTEDDLQPPEPFPFTVSDFLDHQRHEFPRDEHQAKRVILAHLWQHDVDFTWLDIGANIGYSAVPCAKFMQRFGEANAIHAFEPGLAADLLPANIELNCVGDLVHAHRLAVSDRAAPVAFHSMLGHSVCDSVTDFRAHYPHLVPALTRVVSATTIDEFVRAHLIANTLILKIDAEGHDLQVLRGARETFEREQVGVAIIEFVPHYLKEFLEPEQLLLDLSRDHHLVSILELRPSYHWCGRALPDDPAAVRRFARDVARSPLQYTDIVAIARRLPGAEELRACLCDQR